MNESKNHLSSPFFSVGVTTYDRVEMLIETLKSILGQTFHDYEVIVSNDNPNRTLNGASLGIDDPRVIFVNQPKNLGEFYNMNFLLKSSRGKYFTWLADDDLYHTDYLLSVHRILTKYDYPPCVFSSFDVIHENGYITKHAIDNAGGTIMKGHEFLQHYLNEKIKAIGVMGFFEREYLISIGGGEDLSCDGKGMLDEYMLLLRTGTLGRVAYINEPLILFRVHENSWGDNNIDHEMYRRAGKNLISKSIDILKMPALRGSFYSNFSFILKLCLAKYIAKLEKSGELTTKVLLSRLYEIWGCIISIRGSLLYPVAIIALMKIEAIFIMDVMKRRILSKIRRVLLTKLKQQ